MRVCFVAAPLTARSGVYRSGRELVSAGRALGFDWHLQLGVSSQAPGDRPNDDPAWITEYSDEPSGFRGVLRQSRRLRQVIAAESFDLVISLLPQTDMALSLTDTPWIAYLRGLPWPANGEAPRAKRAMWGLLERLALRRAREVWATTPVLRDQIDPHRKRIHIVPAGIRKLERTWDGTGSRTHVIWAARFDVDKRPELFTRVLDGLSLDGLMYGSGRLMSEVRRHAPANVSIPGWAAPDVLWPNALAYVGTSSREAFGRSAVEAAMSGIPVVLSSSFGCAPQLITDEKMSRLFLIPDDDPARWRTALERLASDEDLRRSYSDHLVRNADALSIDASVRAVAARLEELPSAVLMQQDRALGGDQ